MTFGTPCENCIFCRPNKSRGQCLLNGYQVQHGDKLVAPGFCRRFSVNIGNFASQKCAPTIDRLQHDVIIIFDPVRQSAEQLKKTYTYYTSCQGMTYKPTNIIIVRLHQSTEQPILSTYQGPNVIVEDMLIPLYNDSEVIRYVSRLVKSAFFLTLPAGKILLRIDRLRDHIVNEDTRSIFWSFPHRISGDCNTLIHLPMSQYGFYVTAAYRQLLEVSTDNFVKSLREISEESGISLHWPFGGSTIADAR